jgi:hypothetical protein
MAVESLALLLFAQQRDRFLIKIDGADALLAFRRAEAESVALSRELLPHSESGSIEVHVTPSQPEQLTASHPCCCGEVIEDELSILGRFRIFRYEMRRWRDGVIPDIGEAVDSPRRLSDDLADARRLLELVPQIPILVWGRDELRIGEMWNSNSIIAWLIARAGLGVDSIKPPPGGRAPGWNAGLVAAAGEPSGSGAGHNAHSERPAEVIQEVRDFNSADAAVLWQQSLPLGGKEQLALSHSAMPGATVN